MVNQPFCKHDNDVGTNVHYHQNLKIRTEDFSALANFKIYINRYFGIKDVLLIFRKTNTC